VEKVVVKILQGTVV